MTEKDMLIEGSIDSMFSDINTHLVNMDSEKEQYEKLKRDGNG